MSLQFKIDPVSRIPVYKQIINQVQDNISKGDFKVGKFLPSMNELANELQISKETVKKAYSILRDNKLIDSAQGKGFYITNNGKDKIKILLLFDKMSSYKQVLFDSFSANLGNTSEITIRLHNQDIELFCQFIEENLDDFDYYVVTPHFPLNNDIQKRAINILKKIPNRKLILIDRHIEKLQGNYGSVYQDFEKDIYDGLFQGIETFRKFKKLNVISMPGSLYAPLLERGIKRFCTENDIDFKIHKNIDIVKVQKGETFLILNSQLDSELIELVRIAKKEGCKIGEDIGIISYNESPINEIVLDGLTVLSTNFKQMGGLAAQMIIDQSFKKIACDFSLIRRSTF